MMLEHKIIVVALWPRVCVLVLGDKVLATNNTKDKTLMNSRNNNTTFNINFSILIFTRLKFKTICNKCYSEIFYYEQKLILNINTKS